MDKGSGIGATARRTAGGQRQHNLIDAVQASLAFTHDDRVEAGVAVARDLDLHRPDLGQYGLDADAVARVATVAPGRVVALAAQVLNRRQISQPMP